MLVIAIIGVLAFLIGLLVRVPQQRRAGGSSAEQPSETARWHEFTLALILLAAIAAFAIWIISSGHHWVWGETIGDWKADTRATVFAAIMIGLGVVGLAVSLAYTLIQSAQAATAVRPAAKAGEAAAPGPAVAPTPSPLRLVALLILAAAILLLCRISLTQSDQYALLLQLIYPGAFAVTLVLLFDKAMRTWETKSRAETVREWLLVDLLAFLLVLAFLNLRGLAKPDAYSGTFWDVLNIVLYFAAFWTIDRTSARSRFLVGYGYLVLLPLLRLIWEAAQGVTAQASWWASFWPFLILAGAFFVLELVVLVASSGERQAWPALKDALFVVLYAVLLIVAAAARVHS